jgi:hypothetical protein
MLSSKKLICKGTLRQVIQRLEIQLLMLVFSSQLCELAPLTFSLVHLFPPSLCE